MHERYRIEIADKCRSCATNIFRVLTYLLSLAGVIDVAGRVRDRGTSPVDIDRLAALDLRLETPDRVCKLLLLADVFELVLGAFVVPFEFASVKPRRALILADLHHPLLPIDHFLQGAAI